LPKVLSSISFQKANSHTGGAFFVNVCAVMSCSCLSLMDAGSAGSASAPSPDSHH
jgi:hypothetical protein